VQEAVNLLERLRLLVSKPRILGFIHVFLLGKKSAWVIQKNNTTRVQYMEG